MTNIKKKLVEHIEKARVRLGMSKTRLAEKLGTSRSQVHRILDPNEARVTLDYLSRAAAAVGLELDIKFSNLKT